MFKFALFHFALLLALHAEDQRVAISAPSLHVLNETTAKEAAAEKSRRWKRHTIDNSSRGADGVRMADVNGDNLLDITTGWEEGGVVRAYLNPGPRKVRQLWPAVTVGNVGSVEDAVFVDLDSDGAVDVVSSCEGKVKAMFVHWAPKPATQFLHPQSWTTEVLPASQESMQWMFCLPMEVDGKNGIDLVAGGKNKNAQLGWFESPSNPRQLSDWKWHPLGNVGWVMSLVGSDMDGDGDKDILFTDRKGENSGCFWIENRGPAAAAIEVSWPIHRIGGQGKEVMFLAQADLDCDNFTDVMIATRPHEILYLRRRDRAGANWESYPIPLPSYAGGAKAVDVGDIDLDGKLDLVFTCEGATAPKSGVMWLSYRNSPLERAWDAHDISESDGVKHDLVRLVDLDHDGDLDVITCEETKNLGVFWYENPTH